MGRGIGALVVVFVLLGGVAIGVGAYNAGERNGVQQGIEQVQVAQENGQEVQVVHVVGDGHPWFFPGFFLFPLFLIGGIVLLRVLFFGAGRWGGRGPGPWDDEGRRRFEERAREWHDRQHGAAPAAPGGTTTA